MIKKILCICADSDFQSHQRSEVIHFQWVCNLKWHKQTPKIHLRLDFENIHNFSFFWPLKRTLSQSLLTLLVFGGFSSQTYFGSIYSCQKVKGALWMVYADGLCVLLWLYQRSNWTPCPPVCSDLIGFNSSWFKHTNTLTHTYTVMGFFQSIFWYHPPRQHYLHDDTTILILTNQLTHFTDSLEQKITSHRALYGSIHLRIDQWFFSM